jgi:E3 ubiquitin-protein ligase UBR4
MNMILSLLGPMDDCIQEEDLTKIVVVVMVRNGIHGGVDDRAAPVDVVELFPRLLARSSRIFPTEGDPRTDAHSEIRPGFSRCHYHYNTMETWIVRYPPEKKKHHYSSINSETKKERKMDEDRSGRDDVPRPHKSSGNGTSVLCTTGGSVTLIRGLLLLPKEEEGPVSQGLPKKKNTKKNDDAAWLWKVLLQSYSRHERWLLWRKLSVPPRGDEDHHKFAGVRWLLDGPIHSMLRRQQRNCAHSLAASPVLQEALAFLQDIVYRRRRSTDSDDANHKTDTNHRGDDNINNAEIQALFFFYWPRFCRLLWQMAQMLQEPGTAQAPLRAALAAWAQFLYHAADAAFWKDRHCGTSSVEVSLSPLANWMAAHYSCPRLVPGPPLEGRPSDDGIRSRQVQDAAQTMVEDKADLPVADPPHDDDPEAADRPPEKEEPDEEGSVDLSVSSSANSDSEIEYDEDEDGEEAPASDLVEAAIHAAETDATQAVAAEEEKRARVEIRLADPPDWMEVVDREMLEAEAGLMPPTQQALERILLRDVVDQPDDEDDDDDDDILQDDDDDDDAMELEEIQAVVAASEKRFRDVFQGENSGGQDENPEDETRASPTKKAVMTLEQRTMYIQAAMQVLALQHQHSQTDTPSSYYLSIAAENELLGSLNQVVQPPKESNATQILLRRAPTQEEYFRGSLRRNPIAVSSLGPEEPTVGDLRNHIAQELQMADSAELLEIIVANKILDTQLKLRVVQQVLWKKSLLENSNGNNNESSLSSLLASSSGGAALFSTGLALSLLLSHSTSRGRVTADTPLNQLPPMVAMYRLAGVDGEATEEHVTDLPDPEAAVDAGATPAALEAAWALSRWVTEGRGAAVLLRSIQNHVADVLRQIRRDAVGLGAVNAARVDFQKCPPPHGLTLLRHVAQLAPHRKRLLQARAPTILLALLLDILKVLEGADTAGGAASASNPTAEILQEMIELLTSDISTSSLVGIDAAVSEKYEDQTPDASSLPLLLHSIETIPLSAPLRIAIGKMLPFLTYGQPELCRELARRFDTYLQGDELCSFEKGVSDESANNGDTGKNSILVHTFVQTAISLPANDVCHSLRLALSSCVQRLALWVLLEMPEKPAPWTPALLPMGKSAAPPDVSLLEDAWRKYYARPGIRTALRVLTGLCRRHAPTQSHLATIPGFVPACHWLETISDSASTNVQTEGLGLLAETLLDELIMENEFVRNVVESVRNATRTRKKQMAQEQRQRALLKIGSFGIDAMVPPIARPLSIVTENSSATAPLESSVVSTSANRSKSRKRKQASKKPAVTDKPAWLSEAEQMQDEVGLTCAVCQEGHTLQPSELLGLYVYMKKVTLPVDHGNPAAMTGANLLRALPAQLPDALLGFSAAVDAWFASSKSVAVELSASSSSLFSASHRNRPASAVCSMTVTAGTGIHYGCHRRASQADRNHPKAPKSEWEGATLRNNRVRCNAILPLVAGPNQSQVSLVAMESALSEYSSTVTNTLGSAASSKAALWTILHDLRLLLLRISYNESLSSDCGGGSLASNCQLIYYECFLIQMLDRNAQMDEDQLECSLHAHGLSAGVLAATAILNADFTGDGVEGFSNDEFGMEESGASRIEASSPLGRYLADAAAMGALTSVVFHNTYADGTEVDGLPVDELPHPKRRWIVGKDYFWQALVLCAGRRHAMGITGSGCVSSFSSSRSSTRSAEDRSKPRGTKRQAPSSSEITMNEMFVPLRPMVVYYVILQQLSQDYSPALLSATTVAAEDPLEPCVERLVQAVGQCWKSTNLAELLSEANITMDHQSILHWFQKGMRSL